MPHQRLLGMGGCGVEESFFGRGDDTLRRLHPPCLQPMQPGTWERLQPPQVSPVSGTASWFACPCGSCDRVACGTDSWRDPLAARKSGSWGVPGARLPIQSGGPKPRVSGARSSGAAPERTQCGRYGAEWGAGAARPGYSGGGGE
jgi:hypothetical protein